MMLTCQYAVARFLPYVETEEFANFGIVLFCPDNGFFGFKLLAKQAARITGFFDELDPLVYRRARDTLHAELVRIQDWIYVSGVSVKSPAPMLFAELTRPREAIIRFSDVRVVLARDPDAELRRLFEHYVKRSFATPEYKDRIVNKSLRRILKDVGIEKDFARETIEAGGYHAAFPFVRRDDDHIRQIIKPLYLAYDDGARIYDHSWQWVGRIRRLKELQFRPNQILVPVKGPRKGDNERYEQFTAARKDLVGVDATVIPIEDEATIRELVLSHFDGGKKKPTLLF
jgi:hypothetical protein